MILLLLPLTLLLLLSTLSISIEKLSTKRMFLRSFKAVGNKDKGIDIIATNFSGILKNIKAPKISLSEDE